MDRPLVKQFDKDGDGRLSAGERVAAQEFLKNDRAEGRGPGGPRRRERSPDDPMPKAGPKVLPSSVKVFPDVPLFDPSVLRTFFIEFERADWEKELADFYHTDVSVPARVTVDGKAYANVGVNFRGASSFFTVPEGSKRSLNLAFDFVQKEQRIGGYRGLNLLNSHTDPTFSRSALYYHVARQHIPAPKSGYAHVVINGESWGVYVAAQHFGAELIEEWFHTRAGARWKVPGSPRAEGGLVYLGEDVAPYKRWYDLKTPDDPKAWAALIELCRVLNTTPAEKLSQALEPILDVDGVLKFLALENVFINNDGYWIRTSDYSIYRDEKGRFYLIPHDANETFRSPEGPGFNAQVKGVELDPLTASQDAAKPLLSKLVMAPDLRARYFSHVRRITEEWLNWEKLGPLAEGWQALIADTVQADTHKLYSFENFRKGLIEDTTQPGFRGISTVIGVKAFVDQRRAYLLNHPEVRTAK